MKNLETLLDIITEVRCENLNLKEAVNALEEKNKKAQDDMLYWFKKYTVNN